MKRSLLFTLSAVAFTALVPIACTQDFGAFEPVPGENGSTGGAGGTSASDVSSGSGSGGGGGGGQPNAQASSSASGDPAQCTGGNMCDDQNPCTKDGCDLTAHSCFHTKINGQSPAIDDNNPCTDEICVEGALQQKDSDAGKSCGSSPNVNRFCDGKGQCVGCLNPKQCAAGTECQTPTCVNFQCGFDNVARGTSCGGGNKCDGSGACVACLINSDCPGGNAICSKGVCVASTCKSGVQDGDETDVDCGGSQCGPCPLGSKCGEDSDCIVNSCPNGFCGGFPATCLNNMKDGGETDVDCGGLVCKKCGFNKGCITGADCFSNKCINNICK